MCILLMITLITVTHATDEWALRPMSVGSTSFPLQSLQIKPIHDSTTSLFSSVKINNYFYNLIEGSNVTIGIELLKEPGANVPITITPINSNMAKDASYISTFQPMVVFPVSETLTIPKTDWQNNIYLISIAIKDDAKVNPYRSEEINIQIETTLWSTPLIVTLYVTENDVLECDLGYRHSAGHSFLVDKNGHKSPDCTPCQPGTYNALRGVDLCSKCPSDTFSVAVAQQSLLGCQVCTFPTITYDVEGSNHPNKCMCPEEYFPTFIKESHSLTNGIVDHCNPCPKGANCILPGSYAMNVSRYSELIPNISRSDNATNPFIVENWLKSKEGYWKIPWINDTSVQFIKCLDASLCHANDICRNNSGGNMCNKCDKGFYNSGGSCEVCSSTDIGVRIGIIVGLVLFWFLILRLLNPVIKKYKGAWRDLLRVIKIQLDFWQVNSSMPSVLGGIDFPPLWLALVSKLSFVNFDFSKIVNLQCLDGVSFYASFAIMSIMPLFAIGLGLVKYQIRKFQHILERKKGHMPGGDDPVEQQKAIMEGLRIAFNIADIDNSGFIDVHEFTELVRNLGFKKFKDKHAQKLFNKRSGDGDGFLDLEEFKALVLDKKNKVHIDMQVIAWSAQRRDMFHTFADVSQLLLLVHTPVARSFFTYFDCVNLGGQKFLKSDITVSCDTDGYYSFMGFIMFVGVLFVIGFPLAIAIYLILHRKELYAVRVTDKIGFLYDRFHKGSEFWELHEIIRKVMLTGIAVALAKSPMLQTMFATLVCLAAQVNLNYFKPHKNSAVFFIAQICFTAITTKYMVALLLTGNSEASLDPKMGFFLVFVDMATTFCGVLGLFLAFCVLWQKIKTIKVAAKKEKEDNANGGNSTKIVPMNEHDEEMQMLADSKLKIDDITKFTNNIQLSSQTETGLYNRLMAMVEIEKLCSKTLVHRDQEIEELKSKIHVLNAQVQELTSGKNTKSNTKSNKKPNNNNNNNNSSPKELMEAEEQLKQLKTQLKKAQSTGGLSASGTGTRATTLVSLLRVLFRKFDPNATGHIGQPGLRDLFLHVMDDSQSIRKTAENDARTVIKAVDTDKNGTVEEEEFVNWIQKGIGQDTEKRKRWGAQSETQSRLLAFLTGVVAYCQKNYLKSIFLEFDADHDDALSKTELVALMVEMKMRSITQTDLTESIKSIAEDADIVMKALDVDQNDTIQLDEFVDWLTEGLSRPSNERKKWAMQGAVFKRLENFLQSVEETASKSGLNQWAWASDAKNQDGQARFLQPPEGTPKASVPKFKHKKGTLKRKHTKNGSIVSEAPPKPPPDKAETFHQVKTKKVPKKVKVKKVIEIDDSKYYLDAADVEREELIAIFQVYDVDNKGGICSEEMFAMMQSRKKQMGMFVVQQKDCDIIMKSLDNDGNGMIESGEFADWILSGLQRSREERSAWANQNRTCMRLDKFLSAVHKDVLGKRDEQNPEEEVPES